MIAAILNIVTLTRRGSRVTGDGFAKQRGRSRWVKGHAPLGNILDIFIPKVPFPGLPSNFEKSD